MDSFFRRFGSQLGYLALGIGMLWPMSMNAQQAPAARTQNALVNVLVKKGVLTPEEAGQITSATTAQQANERIALMLLAKGVITASDYTDIVGHAPEQTKPLTPAIAAVVTTPAPAPQTATVTVPAPAPAIAAIAPIRALPVGGVPRDQNVPTLKSNGVGITSYGIVKVTGAEDSSSPDGDDFPLPGFMNDTGPDGSPEFHLKARATRLGVNLAWFDPSPKWSITGKVEFDFEGNFNRSDNRNVSSVRSNNPSLRLAWARTDFRLSDRTTLSALFGQDWTPFASSTLPNMLETTGCGIGFGTLYERTPQMRVGFTHKFTAIQIMPEFAIALPAAGLTPSAANLAMQLGYGERQGADSNQPNLEGRVVAQWQLDHAAGVAPAQLIVSGEHGKRTAIVAAAAVPTAYKAAFTKGATVSSDSNGWTVEAQLPTRWATLIGKFYGGSDLRYFFGGQLYSNYNDTTGLTDTATVASVDGSSNVIFGTDANHVQVVAPQRPLRTEGGFAQLGLPLSRLLKAKAGSRAAGWTLYAMYSVDQVKTRDLNRLGATGTRRYSTMAVGTLNYNLNKWVMFSLEQSLYATHANPEQPLPLFRGVPAREWNDVRTEFGPTFTF